MDNKYHHGDLKIQLIKSGLQMIQEDGINRLSLRRLAQMCNVSEAACKCQYKNVGFLENKSVGFPTSLFSIF